MSLFSLPFAAEGCCSLTPGPVMQQPGSAGAGVLSSRAALPWGPGQWLPSVTPLSQLGPSPQKLLQGGL